MNEPVVRMQGSISTTANPDRHGALVDLIERNELSKWTAGKCPVYFNFECWGRLAARIAGEVAAKGDALGKSPVDLLGKPLKAPLEASALEGLDSSVDLSGAHEQIKTSEIPEVGWERPIVCDDRPVDQ